MVVRLARFICIDVFAHGASTETLGVARKGALSSNAVSCAGISCVLVLVNKLGYATTWVGGGGYILVSTMQSSRLALVLRDVS